MLVRLTKGLALAATLGVAAVSAQAQTTLLSESFADVSTLSSSGWLTYNVSQPGGTVPGWFQGNTFTSTTDDYSYIASNFHVSADGGQISNWLFTPSFSTAAAGSVSFWVRGAAEAGYTDQISYGLSTGSNVFNVTMATPVTASGDWTQYTLNFSAMGAGSMARLAIVHTGSADLANYVGVDNLVVTAAAAVPEPQTWLLMGLGLAGVGLLKSRRREAA